VIGEATLSRPASIAIGLVFLFAGILLILVQVIAGPSP
jgi:hypothetical protein